MDTLCDVLGNVCTQFVCDDVLFDLHAVMNVNTHIMLQQILTKSGCRCFFTKSESIVYSALYDSSEHNPHLSPSSKVLSGSGPPPSASSVDSVAWFTNAA